MKEIPGHSKAKQNTSGDWEQEILEESPSGGFRELSTADSPPALPKDFVGV